MGAAGHRSESHGGRGGGVSVLLIWNRHGLEAAHLIRTLDVSNRLGLGVLFSPIGSRSGGTRMKTISVRGLTKEFKLGNRREQYRMLHQWLSLRRPNPATGSSASLMALDDVSFDAAPGDVIGILGRNGAGKSTLLKVLARILRPTRGHVELRGRVGSLLEVGSGFHGELTGRENIFLNAAILGMQHREIVRKLDEIVDFAGVGSQLDEPVKT